MTDSAAKVLAMHEWIRGERGDEGGICLMGLRDSEQGTTTGLFAFVRAEDLNHDGGPAPVTKLCELGEFIENNGHDALIVAAWGGRDAHRLLEDFGEQWMQPAGAERSPIVSALRIEQDQVSENTQIGLDPSSGEWAFRGPMPDVSDEMIPRGYKPPATSWAERAAGLEPVSDPLPSINAGVAETITRVHPSSRIETSRECLDDLAYASSEGIDEPQKRAGDIQFISQCVASDVVVRDAVASYAATHRTRLAALIEAYRQAPVENRAAMSSCAATANVLGAGSSQATEILAYPASQETEQADMAGLACHIGSRGINPNPIRNALEMELPEHIDKADTAFSRQKDNDLATQVAGMSPAMTVASEASGPEL